MIAELREIGLTENEAKTYLSLLKIGKSSIGKIISDSQTTRSKIYDLLDKLKQKGLVTQTTIDGVKIFAATNLDSLFDYIEQKESELQQNKAKIKKILPSLIEQQQKSDSNIELYVGKKGVATAFSRVTQQFTKEEEYLVLGGSEGEDEKWTQRFFATIQDRRKRKKVKSRVIYTQNAKGKFSSQEKSSLNTVRYIPHTAPTAINIYKNCVLILILKQQPVVTFYEDKAIADSFREYFETTWKIASK